MKKQRQEVVTVWEVSPSKLTEELFQWAQRLYGETSVNTKAVLSQGNRASSVFLPTSNDSSIVINLLLQMFIHCIKADLNVKL